MVHQVKRRQAAHCPPLVESLRPDAWLVAGIPTAQLVSAALVVAGVGLIAWRRQDKTTTTGEAAPK